MSGSIALWRDGLLRLLALAARPARCAHGGGGAVVEPYRGYGSDREAFLIGRVFRQRHADQGVGLHHVRAHLRDIGWCAHRGSGMLIT